MSFNPKELIGSTGNYPLYCKKIFLTFLQAYFSRYDQIDTRFQWTSDFRTTKILIVDKKAYDTSTHERPAIVINRGPLGWANTTLGQLSTYDFRTGETTYSDLIPTSISINCIGANGMELEELASIIMNAITAFKVELRKEGVHLITRIAIGQETQLRHDVVDLISVVPVDVAFVLQAQVAQTYKYYPLTVKYTVSHTPETADTTPNPYWEVPTKTWEEPTRTLIQDITMTERTDYTVTTSGLLSFTDAPPTEHFVVSGLASVVGPNDGTAPAMGSSEGLDSPGYLPKGEVTWAVRYTRADTLESTSYVLPADDTATLFALPGGIYGYGTVFQEFNLTETVDD